MSISCLLCLNTYTINIYIFRYCNLSNSESKSNGLFPIFYLSTCNIYFILHSSPHFVLVYTRIFYIYIFIVYMVIYVFICYNRINNNTYTYIYMYALPHIFYHDTSHTIKKIYFCLDK